MSQPLPFQRHDDDLLRTEVLGGLRAARQYELSKPRPSPSASEDMLDDNFPRLPGRPSGDLSIPQASDDEVASLQSALRNASSERTLQGMANLREQIKEYHSLLDRLETMTARYNALEAKYTQREGRVQELEHEVAALRRQNGARRVSCTMAMARAAGQGASRVGHTESAVARPVPQMQPSRDLCQPSAMFAQHQAQAPSAFCPVNQPVEHMQAMEARRRLVSRVSPAQHHVQQSGGASGAPPAHFSYSAHCQLDEGGSKRTRLKRAISNETDLFAVDLSHPPAQDAKKFKGDVFPARPY